MDSFQSTIQQMLNENKRRDTFKYLTSLTGLKLNREQVNRSLDLFYLFFYNYLSF
jgi:hypothetical protein